MIELQVQTRSEQNGLDMHKSLEAAFERAMKDPTVWKISFSLLNGERIRLVLTPYGWMYDSISSYKERK